MATMYQKQQIARRRTSDITRLASEYQRNVSGLTTEYETAFSKWQKEREAVMTPYQAELTKYKTALEDYTKNVAEPYKAAVETYNTKAAAYQKLLDDYSSGKYDVSGSLRSWYENSVYRSAINLGGREVPSDVVQNPGAYGYQFVYTPVQLGRRGQNYYLARPKISEPAPEKPAEPTKFTAQAPVEPTVKAFDQAPFEQKKTELESQYKREVDERKAAKLGAVQRKSARPLLQGANP